MPNAVICDSCARKEGEHIAHIGRKLSVYTYGLCVLMNSIEYLCRADKSQSWTRITPRSDYGEPGAMNSTDTAMSSDETPMALPAVVEVPNREYIPGTT